MIKTDDVVKFIEASEGIKLFDYQIRLVDNIVHGFF